MKRKVSVIIMIAAICFISAGVMLQKKDTAFKNPEELNPTPSMGDKDSPVLSKYDGKYTCIKEPVPFEVEISEQIIKFTMTNNYVFTYDENGVNQGEVKRVFQFADISSYDNYEYQKIDDSVEIEIKEDKDNLTKTTSMQLILNFPLSKENFDVDTYLESLVQDGYTCQESGNENEK